MPNDTKEDTLDALMDPPDFAWYLRHEYGLSNILHIEWSLHEDAMEVRWPGRHGIECRRVPYKQMTRRNLDALRVQMKLTRKP